MPPLLIKPLIFVLLLNTTCLINTATAKPMHRSLVLELDSLILIEQPLGSHTFAETNTQRQRDLISKQFSKASNTFKKLTSLKFRKHQKVKAIIGLTSYRVQYIYAL